MDTDALPHRRSLDWRKSSSLRSHLFRHRPVLPDELRQQDLNLEGWA